jgi:hypothetical protein
MGNLNLNEFITPTEFGMPQNSHTGLHMLHTSVRFCVREHRPAPNCNLQVWDSTMQLTLGPWFRTWSCSRLRIQGPNKPQTQGNYWPKSFTANVDETVKAICLGASMMTHCFGFGLFQKPKIKHSGGMIINCYWGAVPTLRQAENLLHHRVLK